MISKTIDNKGSVLITALLIISILMLIGISALRMSFSQLDADGTKWNGLKTFYLSEAGIEKAKTEIAKDHYWSTDPSHSENDKTWLVRDSSGIKYFFGYGGFKIVKEKNKNCIYSIGFLGASIERSSCYSFIKISYDTPFKQTRWERL